MMLVPTACHLIRQTELIKLLPRYAHIGLRYFLTCEWSLPGGMQVRCPNQRKASLFIESVNCYSILMRPYIKSFLALLAILDICRFCFILQVSSRSFRFFPHSLPVIAPTTPTVSQVMVDNRQCSPPYTLFQGMRPDIEQRTTSVGVEWERSI